IFLFVPAQAVVARYIESFRDFPPRAKAASFSVSDVMDKITSGSKSELADASASSRSPPLTEAKAGRNCSAQGRPVAQPSFTRPPGVGPISLHEAKAFPGEPGSSPDRHISDSPSV